MTLREAALRAHPDFPWLEASDRGGLQHFFERMGWFGPGERVCAARPAGGGNMNLTLRVHTDRRSFILKQARPWVEKYDHIAAPWNRSDIERRFYERVRAIPGVGTHMPRLLASDAASRVLLLEDLAGAHDLSGLYRNEGLRLEELDQLADYLRALHGATRDLPDPKLANREMRALNHAHLFVVPLDPNNGLALDAIAPGLANAARELIEHGAYRRIVAEVGERYLEDGHFLVHGDYFPGSWLRSDSGLRIIDPEFCFYGDAEFDVGCALAHLALARQDPGHAERLVARYRDSEATASLDLSSVARYAAVEVMRRLIGVAQLPLPEARQPGEARDPRCELLSRSRDALLTGSLAPLLC